MKKRLALALLAGGPWLLSACSSTQLINQWSDPRFSQQRLHHVLVYTENPDIGMARSIELEVATSLGELTRATPAYEVFGDTALSSLPKAQIQATLQSRGIDGLLLGGVSRTTFTEKYVPPEYQTGFWSDGWGYGWGGTMVTPGYSYVSTSTYVQGMLYAVADGRLVWSAQTRTTDPGNLEHVRQDIQKLIADSLKQAQVLAR